MTYKLSTIVSVGILFLLLGSLVLFYHQSRKPQQIAQHAAGTPATITVDYTSVLRTLDPLAIGMDISGYQTPSVFANDTVEQQKLKALGVTYLRMDFHYATPGDPTSQIICGGNGCMTSIPGDQWINAIKAIGAVPVVIVPETSVTDAANLVKHFNKDTNNPVSYWIIGNEPDNNGISAQTYSTNFNQEYDAMKAVDPTIKVGGGTTAWYDQSFLQTFLQQSGSRVDFVDFHGYPQQGTTPGNPSVLFQQAKGYGNDVGSLRALIQATVPSRAAQIGIEVGEWELNWGGTAQDYLNFHAVWAADVLGNILQAGGKSMFYADKGNAIFMNSHTLTDSLGRTYTVSPDDTNPAYHGIGMFTGEGLFQGFGNTMVNATTTLPNVDVFASDNPKDIVVINKDPTLPQNATFSFNGLTTGTVTVWRKDESVSPQNPPVNLGSVAVQNSSFTYQLLPYSVTTFALAQGTSQPSISPTPLVSIMLTPTTSSQPTPVPSLSPMQTLSPGSPSNTLTPSLTPGNLPSGTKAPATGSIAVVFDGINQTSTPHHPQRNLIVSFYTTQDFTTKPVYQLPVIVSYNPTANAGVFANTAIDLRTIAQGAYFILVKSQEGSLREEASPTAVQIAASTVTQLNGATPLRLPLGDVNNDNVIDLADYNILVDCYGTKAASRACTAHHLSDALMSNFADFDDDGVVNGVDYNILIRNFGVNGI